jgi:peptide/nickel transport system substrate-binding protein
MLTKLRFKFELLFLYFKRNWIYFIVSLVISSSLIIFRQNLINLYQKINHQTQKIGVEGLFTSSNLPPEISQKISFGLTINTNGDKFITSSLVKSLDIQNDQTQYLFELNSEIKWHNNQELKASDFDYKIAGLNISSPDSNHLIIQTEKPFAPIFSTLSQPLIKKNFNGLGEYEVDNFEYQDGYLKSLLLKSASQRILYRFYQNETDLINAFKIGEVDEIEVSSVPPEFNDWPKINITKNIRTDQRYLAIFINTEKFGGKQFRQALAYATPKTSDLNERALSPISPTSWAYNPDVKEYAFNQARAKELIEEEKIESINLSYNDRRLIVLADNIKKSWEEILGIKVNAQISNQIDTQNFDVILAYGSILNDPDQYLFWHSTQTKTNITKINHPPIDKLLEEGRQTFDQQERKKIYQEFQKILLEESPAIFLKYPILYTVSRN